MISDRMRKAMFVPLLVLLLFMACGETEDKEVFSITGRVTVDEACQCEGSDIFVALFKGTDPDMIARSSGDSFASIVGAAPDGSFSIDLADHGLDPGETVTLIGFVDQNYNGGIPSPATGDMVGFYIKDGTFTPGYTLADGLNTGADIHVNREVFAYEKEIGGTISGDYTGPVRLFAYAGDIRSLDVTTLDVNGIIGYGAFEKKESLLDYRLSILPYGFDLPISDVYLMALFDTNGNGVPDAGESVGYCSTHPQGLPSLFTLTDAPQEHFTVDSTLSKVIPEASPEEISIAGHVERPAGYDETSTAPLFIVAAETDDPNLLFTHPLSVIRAFYRLDPGELAFSLDLSATGLSPGNTLMTLALWDLNHKENPESPSYTGFPDPDAGDLVGIYQNKTNLTVTHTLNAGVNSVVPLKNGNTDFRFQVNRLVVDHDASLVFTVQNGGGVTLESGDRLLVVAVQEDGVDNATYRITDPDCIVAMETVTATGDINDAYAVPLMGALLQSILNTPFGVDDVYVFAILDENGNGKPDNGEPVGFYWSWILTFFPKLTNLTDGENRLETTVRFTGMTY
ncbi:hypothetical protein DSLASN_07920 [Desulfoluna limicola]|uniref:Lipoprotein n=1 Tax=Desulfoluna limicola TaxID=2810562 RepID=A0ABM7PC69_9BACT|nr:hypothetical protein [Desulfoluna limicola]BCS95160.1 hypothetical protein DSLASN_07920 [Desulfoluna limicola]